MKPIRGPFRCDTAFDEGLKTSFFVSKDGFVYSWNTSGTILFRNGTPFAYELDYKVEMQKSETVTRASLSGGRELRASGTDIRAIVHGVTYGYAPRTDNDLWHLSPNGEFIARERGTTMTVYALRRIDALDDPALYGIPIVHSRVEVLKSAWRKYFANDGSFYEIREKDELLRNNEVYGFGTYTSCLFLKYDEEGRLTIFTEKKSMPLEGSDASCPLEDGWEVHVRGDVPFLAKEGMEYRIPSHPGRWKFTRNADFLVWCASERLAVYKMEPRPEEETEKTIRELKRRLEEVETKVKRSRRE